MEDDRPRLCFCLSVFYHFPWWGNSFCFFLEFSQSIIVQEAYCTGSLENQSQWRIEQTNFLLEVSWRQKLCSTEYAWRRGLKRNLRFGTKNAKALFIPFPSNSIKLNPTECNARDFVQVRVQQWPQLQPQGPMNGRNMASMTVSLITIKMPW